MKTPRESGENRGAPDVSTNEAWQAFLKQMSHEIGAVTSGQVGKITLIPTRAHNEHEGTLD